MKDEMLVDQKCYDLAEHFLNRSATDAMKQELAEWIQHHIELWLYDDRDGAMKAAQRLGLAIRWTLPEAHPNQP